MGYRRPHHRRAHTRTNSDGSKSYVKETDVKGHDYKENHQRETYISYSGDENIIDGFLGLLLLACIILFVLGLLLRWDDTLWYFVIGLVSFLLLYLRNK